MGDRSSLRNGLVTPRALLAFGLLALAGCNPMAAWTNNESGKAYYRAGRFAEAREEFRRAAADSPNDPDYTHNFATAARRAGDHAAAEQAYRQALNLDPSHQPSYHGLAVTLKETGRTAEAHSLLSTWAAAQPYSEKAYIEMAWLQREMGDHTGAERSLAQALRIRPGHPLALANLGQIYEESGRGPLAVAAYQKSLASDWNQPQVATRVARLQGVGGAAAPRTIASAPGTIIAGAAAPQVASLPTGYPTGPVLVPPYRSGGGMATAPFQPPSGGMATAPFRPTAGTGLATRPFTPAPNVPLAANPYRPTANVPLAASPFTSSQAFLNVPSMPPAAHAPGGPAYGTGHPAAVAAPYTRQPH